MELPAPRCSSPSRQGEQRGAEQSHRAPDRAPGHAAACQRNRADGWVLQRLASTAIVGAEPARIVLLPGLAVDDLKAVAADLGLGLKRLAAARA